MKSRDRCGEGGEGEEWRGWSADGDLPRVFARVAPGQKLQLVRKLQRSGLVVAMIGDGVNDTPPLRAADIGIALGRSGVDAARSIADVVLLADDLASLTDAVERGRTAAINIRNAIRSFMPALADRGVDRSCAVERSRPTRSFPAP